MYVYLPWQVGCHICFVLIRTTESIRHYIQQPKKMYQTLIMMLSSKKKLLTISLCFAITAITAALIFAGMNIYPGGRFTVLTSDLSTQYMPYIYSIRYLGNGDSSLFFSLLGGLGINYLANFAYYASSPLNFLTLAVSVEHMPEAMYFLTLLKLGLCSVSFCIYILYGLKHNTHRSLIILLSVAYGLSAYNMTYSMCLMWLDGVILLPLILLGIERLLSGKSGSVYVLALTLSLYCNYYITYMSGLFICMYIVYRIVALDIKRKKVLHTFFSFSFLSAISLGLSMPMILPTLKYTSLGKLNEPSGITDHLIRVGPWRILRNLFPFGEYYLKSEGAPQLYCGTITVVLIVIFFISKTFHRREKATAAAIFLVYFISIMYVPLDRIWHGFRDPVCLPVRYSFTAVCFMLVIACRALDSEFVSNICNYNKISKKMPAVYTILLAIVLCELGFNGTTALMGVNNNSHFIPCQKYDNDISHIKKALGSINDNGLFRTISSDPYTLANGFLFNYNDVGYYSSVYNANLHNYLKQMGGFNVNHILYDPGITPVLANLLGVKYYLGKDTDYYKPEYIAGNKPFATYKSMYALPIGYMVDSGEKTTDLSDNPFINQEKLVEMMVGHDVDLYQDCNYEITDIRNNEYARSSNIKVNIEKDGPIWVYFPLGTANDRKEHDIYTNVNYKNFLTVRTKEFKIIVNDKHSYDFMIENSPFCVYIGDYRKGDSLDIYSYSTAYYNNPFVVTMDEAIYSHVMAELSENTLDVTSHGNGIIEGTVNGVPGRSLILSLPYMNGYSIYLDGQITSYSQYTPAMVSVDIPEGIHKIRISYLPPGLNAGIIIGILSLILFLSYMVYMRKQTRQQSGLFQSYSNMP